MTAEIPEDRRAPDGHIWQCRCCGKIAEDRFGLLGERSRGWDESCMLNAIPVARASSTTRRPRQEPREIAHNEAKA